MGLDSLLIKPTTMQLVKSGDIIEIYKFAVEITYGRKGKIENEIDDGKNKKKVASEDSLASSARRTKRNIKRLMYSNVWRWLKADGGPYTPIPITLTFKDEVTDVAVGNMEFTKFIRRLNYEVGIIEGGKNIIESKKSELQYLAVIEFQKKSQRVHYHILFFNLPYMRNIYDRMRKIWGRGIFNVNGKHKGSFKSKSKHKGVEKILGYYCKYITDNHYDKRLFKKKKFFASRNLLKPIKIVGEAKVREIRAELPTDSLEWQKEDIPVPYLQSFSYYRYNLAKYPELEKEITNYIDPYFKIQ